MRIGLYVHVPFCVRKCAYCDFASIAGRGDLYAPFGQAVIEEMRRRPGLPLAQRAADFIAGTIYIGGGTPTVLPLAILREILVAAREIYRPLAGAEITVEANPGTVDRAYLAALREAGVNRLSVGVQTFDDAELRRLGRIHDRQEASDALAAARAAGFRNLSLDLIFGLPAQSMESWNRTLEAALACRPTHISLYALSVEEGTPLQRQIARGELPPPDEDLAADMYEMAGFVLGRAGFEHYEISNWALPGFESRHNVHTWRNGDYLGFGPAAHSHLGRRRWWNVGDPEAYLAGVRAGSPVAGFETLDQATDMAETMILGLRLVKEGVAPARFLARYGRTPAEVYGPELEELAALGLLEIADERIRLTRRGRLLGNQVFSRFVDAG